MTIFINVDDFIASLSFVSRLRLQYSSQIVETDTAFLEFSTKFLRFTPHTFVLTAMCPVFKYPNQRPGRGNANKCFKIFGEDCSSVCL